MAWPDPFNTTNAREPLLKGLGELLKRWPGRGRRRKKKFVLITTLDREKTSFFKA